LAATRAGTAQAPAAQQAHPSNLRRLISTTDATPAALTVITAKF
jgi:hypothetical protein